ncbi:MAG: hypothetical protein ACO21B_12625 [Gemmobacter sp.]
MEWRAEGGEEGPGVVADKVADEVAAFRDEVGDFGTLLYAGHDWADPALARRSMVLLAEEVLPRVNARPAMTEAAE